MKFKKLVSALLVLAMTFSFTACGGGNDTQSGGAQGSNTEAGNVDAADMSVVKVAIPSIMDVTDAPMVQDELNKIYAEKYGVQVELTFINAGSWSQQSNLLLTGDEVDVICYWMLPLNTFVANGQCTDLTEYVANASDEFKALFTDEQMAGCQINGVQWAIPNMRNYGNDMTVSFDEAKLAELGYSVEDIKTMDDVEAVLYAAHEKYPDIYTVVPQTGATFCNGWTWDGLGDQNNVGVIEDCGQSETVVDIFESEDFKEFCTYTRKWYNDGLMMGDALSNQDDGSILIQNGLAFATFGNSSNAAPPIGLTRAVIVENWTDSTNISALTYGINPLSNDPDNAWKVLESMYVDKDVMTLLVDGIEGIHYVLNEDGSASYPEGVTSATSTYSMATTSWALPYANGIPVIDELGSTTFFEELVAFNNESRISKAAGFVLDTDEMGITDEYAACLSVIDKYYNGLMNGVLDPETVMAQAHQEMVDAGIEKIIAAKQAAYDELLGK